MNTARYLFSAIVLVALGSGPIAAQDEPQSIDPPDTTSSTPSVVEEPKSDEAEPKSDHVAPKSDHVARAIFTSGVEEREPVDQLDVLSEQVGVVFFFTEIIGLEGQTITHRWVHEGTTMAEVPIAIGGPRWRVYSSKSLPLHGSGLWTVQVLAEDGTILQESEIRVTEAAAPGQEP